MKTILGPNGKPVMSAQRISSIKNHYQAAYHSPARGHIAWSNTDDATEMAGWERLMIGEKSWFMYKNSPFFRGLFNRLVTYTVGTGIYPVPSSSDKRFNQEARKLWKRASRYIDMKRRRTFASCQRVNALQMFIFGDAFTFKGYGQSGRPRIQLIGSRCIVKSGEKGATDIEGVFLKDGRPDAYNYAVKVSGESKTLRVPEEDMVHHLVYEMPGQVRGVGIAHAALDTGVDVHEILEFEKAAVKAVSQNTDIIKTAGGQISQEEIQASGGDLSTVDIDGKVKLYKATFGPEARVLDIGDEWTGYVPQRPSPAWEGFMDYMTQTICASTGMPPSFILQMKVGGADTRRDLSIVKRVIEPWQDDLASQYQRVYEHIIEPEIMDGPLGYAPTDWSSCDWYFTKSPTVDNGRDARSDIELVKMGMLTRKEYHAEYAEHYEDVMQQVALEKAMKYELAKENGIPPYEMELLNPNEPGMMQGQAPQDPSQPQN